MSIVNSQIELSVESKEFDDIRPYYDSEAKDILTNLANEKLFYKLVKYFWEDITEQAFIEKISHIENIKDFQLSFMHPAIRRIVEMSSNGLTYSGIENLKKEEAYLFIANHRDILLDSAILQILLVENEMDTSEITFGNNLMEDSFVTKLGKLNRMFTVQREGTSRELYNISKKLSAYIRHTLLNKKASVWIAQRSGRTKDGNDVTQTGLLKMLNISGNSSFESNFAELNIVPLTISYEYEPCDDLKIKEKYLSTLHIQYKKAPDEDINSIISGVVNQKGKIHLAFGKPIIKSEIEFDNLNNENDKIKNLTTLIDNQIYTNYKLWPTNYIAYDILENTNKYNTYYTVDEKTYFVNYIERKIKLIEGDKSVLFSMFLDMYAAPVKNNPLNKNR